MRSGSFSAEAETDTATPDQRLTLILSLFRICRTAEPEATVLQRLVEEVRSAEAGEGGEPLDGARDLFRRRAALCAAVVRRFIEARALS